jgi:hypothetical protein
MLAKDLQGGHGGKQDNNIAPHGGFKPCNLDNQAQSRGSSPEFWFIDRAGDYGYGTYNGGFGHTFNNKEVSKTAEVDPLSEAQWEVVMTWDGTYFKIHSWAVNGVDMSTGIVGKNSNCRGVDQRNLPGAPKIWSYNGHDEFRAKDFTVEQGDDLESLEPWRGGEGVILNPAETARTYSSVWSGQAPGVGHARSMLNSDQAWSAKTNQKGEWVQVDLGSEQTVAGVVTQARADKFPEYLREAITFEREQAPGFLSRLLSGVADA